VRHVRFDDRLQLIFQLGDDSDSASIVDPPQFRIPGW
jgi:hypothetical protein